MGHHVAQGFVPIKEALVAIPVRCLIGEARFEEIGERIASVRRVAAAMNSEEVQIVITEHHDGRIPHRHHSAHNADVVRPSIDEIAQQPQAVPADLKIDPIEEPGKLLVAALDVANGIGGHGSVHHVRLRQ